jgi:hypothetical protein
LADFASRIDGCAEPAAAELVSEFNRLANAEMTFDEFQGIYGAEEHEQFVRRLLIEQATANAATDGITRDDLIEIFTNILANPADETYLSTTFASIRKQFGPNSNPSDLVFWPNLFFDNWDDAKTLTPEIMADAIIQRHKKTGG